MVGKGKRYLCTEDDMDDNGLIHYMGNDDKEGWD
jgi:hypothetical protein